MIGYINNINQDKKTDNSYILYSSVMNAFLKLSDDDKMKILNNLEITFEKLISLFPSWLHTKERTLNKDDTISIIEFNKFLKLIADKLQQTNNNNYDILFSHTDSAASTATNYLITGFLSYLEHYGKSGVAKTGAKWLNWVSLILTLKDAHDFNIEYLQFKKLIDSSNKFYELNYNLSMSMSRYFVYVNSNKENTISTYTETLERVDKVLINLNNLFSFLKQNGIPYQNKLDLFSALMQINEIFNKEKNDLISKINDLKSSINNNDDDYGSGY
ncbi:hypothetical protein [Mycoplasma sp. CR]|uniref:hypothetical protein n=1 Tax=unclassified Mycoplasma TaxID=2683645 RepID=UPI003AAC7E3B